MTGEIFGTHRKIGIRGTREEPEGYLYQLDNRSGVMVREACFDTGKGGKPFRILHVTDLHLHAINEQDEREENPAVYGSLQHRMAFRNRSTLPNLEKVLALVEGFDQVIITGDAIDYLTWGSLELLQEYVWDRLPGVWVTVGGHELTRVMEGEVPDPTTLESRYGILGQYWRHNMAYCSRILGDKAMLIQMNNGESRYLEGEYHRLLRDLDAARKRHLLVLLFQHEPLCTHNPAEKEVLPLRANDGTGTCNFCDSFLGCADSDEMTKRVCGLIRRNADIIKGVFCGHWHSDFYTQIQGFCTQDGVRVKKDIPQYVLTGNMYDNGHVMAITIK